MAHSARVRFRILVVALGALALITSAGIAAATQIPTGCDPSLDDYFYGTCQAARSSTYGDVYGGLTAWAQRTVNDTGIYSLTVDGQFGALTETGVKAYQNYYGISADGIVGNNTWIRMDQYGDIAPWQSLGWGCTYGFEYFIIPGNGIHAIQACDGEFTYLEIGDFCVYTTSGWEKADEHYWWPCS